MENNLIYVTNKQVSNFIERETERLNINNKELLKEVESVLFDLNEFPKDNRNQIKFYARVYKTLNSI